jgi:membrane-anchored protein YejM (alkaline phosphatase superfamily)
MIKKTFLIFLVFGTFIIACNLFYSYRDYNVILITIDTLRADHLSCYNPKAKPTPNIDDLAKRGIMFTNAFSLIPITLPAHTAILSSRPPEELNVFNNGDIYHGRWPLLSDFLRDHQYHTAAFISLPVLNGIFGLGKHFEHFEDDFRKCNGRNYKFASEVNALAIPWIEKNKKERFFAWFHYSDPHEPYIAVDAPPDTEVLINGISFGKYCLRKKEFLTLNFIAQPGVNKIEFVALHAPNQPYKIGNNRFLERNTKIFPTTNMELNFGAEWQDFTSPLGIPSRYFNTMGLVKAINKSSMPVAAVLRFCGGVKGQSIKEIRTHYSAEVQFVDKHIGDLFKRLVDLNLESKTIIVLTADHGEGLKTHEYLNHVSCLYNETIHVPLIMYYPNLGYRGSKVNRIVNHLDIAPTILDLLHIRSSDLRGHSLKADISFAPLDRLFTRKTDRARTFSSTYTPQAKINSFSVIEQNMKLMHFYQGRNQLWKFYDLIQDPREMQDLVKSNSDRFNSIPVQRIRKLLEDHRNQVEGLHNKHHAPILNEEESEMLKSLGYVQGNKD